MGKTAELIKETILVSTSGQWGPKVGNEYYGINEPLTASDFVAGTSYEVLLNQAKPTAKYPNGKKYICQIIGQPTAVSTLGTSVKQSGSVASSPVNAAGFIGITDKSPIAFPSANGKTYQDRKDDSMRIGGLFHDVAQVTAALIMSRGLDQKAALAAFDEVLDALIASRERLDK